MEDLVAIAVELDTGDVRYFITWGRIQQSVDPKPLARLILEQCHHFALGGTALTARVCTTLQEAAQQPLFYEALFSFAQQKIPFGPEYQQWREAINVRMHEGKELYLLGVPTSKSESQSIPHAKRKPTKP